MVECAFELFSQYYPSQNSPHVKAAESDDFHVIGWCAMSENSWGQVMYTIAGKW